MLTFSKYIERFYSRLRDILNQEKSFYFVIFLAAFFLRLLPEIIIPTYPVGYETITYYVPAMIRPEVLSAFPLSIFDHLAFIGTQKPLLDTFRAGPLFYVLMWSLSDLTGANSFLLLKIVGPLLYGFLGISFFIFVRRVLKFDLKTALFTVLLLIFQIATLRESWDRHRDILSISFLFFTLTAMSSKNSKQKYVLTIILSIFTVLSRDYIGFLLLLTVLGYTFYLKKEKIKNLILFAPTTGILLIIFNEVYLHWNYLSTSSPFFLPDYWFAVQDSFAIFFSCYLLLLPLVLKGFRKNRLLTPLLVWLLLGSFSFILFPWFAIPGYQRWLMLLVFPFVIFSVWGLVKINLGKRKKKILTIVLLLHIALGTAYSTGVFSFIGYVPNSYVPISLVQTSIEWDHVEELKTASNWLQENDQINSILLVEERFYGWIMITLDLQNNNSLILVYGANSLISSVLDEAIRSGPDQIYLIWYTNSNIEHFINVYSQENLSVFSYDPN